MTKDVLRTPSVHRLHWETEHRAESRHRRLDESRLLLPELSNGSWDFDLLSPLQPLLTLDQVVDPVDQQLDQLHLKVQPASFTFCHKTEAPDTESSITHKGFKNNVN